MTGALSHLRVLDLSRVLAGPWAGQLLGDLGAEVIKIERPGTGDDTRAWGPPYLEGTTEAAYYLAANRNKQSLTVDIATPEGQSIVRRLAETSDIVIENFKVGGLAAYGLDYASLRAINPALIHCSITGFGATGPYAARAGYDLMIQAMGGLMSITGGKDGTPGGGPQRAGVAVVDLLTGMYATAGILAAVAHRDRTGKGQHIEIALLDTMVACLANQGMNYLVSGVSPVRMGNAHPNIVPYQDFPTADGAIILAVGNDGQFARLCDVLGLDGVAADPRFTANAARIVHRDALVALLAPRLLTRTTSEWVVRLETATVPCGPINAIADVFADPQVQARGLRIDLDHASGGTVPSIANPLHMSATPIRHRAAPPILGQNNDVVLRERLGLSPAEIARLVEQGVVGHLGKSVAT